MDVKHVPGEDKGKVMLYALSTCGWCQKVKTSLNKLGVAYDYVNVDLLASNEIDTALEEVQHWNPDRTFPTLVINDEECIVGYDEAKMKKALSAN